MCIHLYIVARACVALAYPPNGPVNSPVGREQIPPGVPPLGITHTDLHSDNVVVDEFMPQDFEHSIAPLIKV